MTWLHRQELLSTTYLSSLPGLMTSISSLTARPWTSSLRRPSLSTVRVKSSNLRTKSSVSKTSWTTWRLLKRNTEMKMLTSRRELTLRAQGILNSPHLSKILNPRSELRRTKSCTWERSSKVPDTAILPFLIIIVIFRLRSTLLTTILESSLCKMRSSPKSWISLFRPMKLSEWDLTARLESKKSELETTNNLPTQSHKSMKANHQSGEELMKESKEDHHSEDDLSSEPQF